MLPMCVSGARVCLHCRVLFPKNNVEKLERLQTPAARFVLGRYDRYASVTAVI